MWTGVAEDHAGPNDTSARFSWRGVRGKVLARGGSLEAGCALVREAVSIAEPTDALNQQAKLQLDLAEVLRFEGRAGEAAEATARALALYEQKGNLVAVARTRALLGEPGAGVAVPDHGEKPFRALRLGESVYGPFPPPSAVGCDAVAGPPIADATGIAPASSADAMSSTASRPRVRDAFARMVHLPPPSCSARQRGSQPTARKDSTAAR